MARVLFVQKLWFECLGTMYLSAVLKARGHGCDVVIGADAGKLAKVIGDQPPDLLAFSIMTGSHTWALRTAVELKNRYGSPVVFGGPHATFFPEIIREEGVDAVCRGEGEQALLELADALDAGAAIDHIANLWVKGPGGQIVRNDLRPLLQDLDHLPFPDHDLYGRFPGLGDSRVLLVSASRGCPYDCTFCFNHQFAEIYRGKGRLVRHRSPASVIAEIEHAARTRRIERVYFSDDTFTLHRAWLKEFLPLYGTTFNRLPFHCLVRINQIDDRLAGMMRDNGCETVFFGIESGDEGYRNRVLGKGIADEDIRRGAAILKKQGITFRTYNIVGFPGETFAQAMKTVQLNIDIGTDFPWCSLFMPYPGTRLAEYARENGFLDDMTVDAVGNSFHCTSLLRNPERDRLINLHKFFQTAVRWPWVLPIVRQLTRLPVNRFFQVWFSLIYFYFMLRSEGRGFFRTIGVAARNRAFFGHAVHREQE